MALMQSVLIGIIQPGTTQVLFGIMLATFLAQRKLPQLTAIGARIAERITAGESHRLLTSIFMHDDLIHLTKCVVFGLARLTPLVSAIYGTSQCLGLFLLAGLGGNLAAYHLGAPSSTVASIGASAALLGLDGALLAYLLRNGPRSRLELERALRRGAFTLAAACLRPGGRGRIDHAAHLGGYATGVLGGLLLTPDVRRALSNCQEAIFDQMSARVSEACGVTSIDTERAISVYAHRPWPRASRLLGGLATRRLPAASAFPPRIAVLPQTCPTVPRGRYLRTFPRVERKAALHLLKLKNTTRENEVARTEDWQEVFVRVKDFVAQSELRRAADDDDDVGGDDEGEEEKARRFRRRARLRDKAEEAAWKHFEHRAAVSAPSVRLLRRAQMGHIPLHTLRRWRVHVGSVLPLWLGDGVSGLMIAYTIYAMQRVGREAQAALVIR